jgi:hypothetical protein
MNVVANMEKALNQDINPYDSFPSQPTILGGVELDDAATRLRTGSISSARSRSNSIIGKERSHRSSISE